MRIYLFLVLMLFGQMAFSQFNGGDTLATTSDNRPIDLSENTIQLKGGKAISLMLNTNTTGKGEVLFNDEKKIISFNNGDGQLMLNVNRAGELYTVSIPNGDKNLYHISATKDNGFRVRHIPGWASILPPLIAILLALMFKEVIVSLFVGIWGGAFIAGGFRVES